MSENTKITLVQKKIIKSLLYGSYEVMNIFYARIHTCGKNAEYWLYSGLEGALILCIDMRVKSSRFLMIDLKTYETVFDCELYKKFDKAYKKGTERFYYFEVENGFIGFEIPNMEQAELLAASIISFGDEYIKRKLKEYKAMKENEIKEKSKKMIDLLAKKLNQDNKQQKMLRAEIVLKHGILEKMINTVELNDESGKIIVKGNGYQGVDNDLLKLKGLNLDLRTDLKIGDGEIFTKYVSRNFLRSYMKGLIIPKRKINRGEGVTVERHPQFDEQNNESQQGQQQEKDNQLNINLTMKTSIPKNIHNEIQQEPQPQRQKSPTQKMPSLPKPPKRESIKPQPPSIPPKRESIKPQPPPIPPKRESIKPQPNPKPSKKESIKQPSPPKNVEVISNSKGIPPPPPPPPPPPVVKTVKSSSSKPSKPVDLAAELSAKKKNLVKVEIKDLSVPNVQGSNASSTAQTGNSMMAAIMAQRNAMKRVSAPNIPKSALPKNEPQTKKPVAQPPKTNAPSAQKRVSAINVKPAISKPAQNSLNKGKNVNNNSNPKPKPPTSGAKAPMKMSGGGGGGFAAMRNMLQNRMGPQPVKKEEGPKKPIVELTSGNVPRMNMSKLMASLEKNMGKSESTSNAPIKVVSSSGAGVPPPPPPPPPPPKV